MPPISVVRGFRHREEFIHELKRGMVTVVSGPHQHQLPQRILNFFRGLAFVHFHSPFVLAVTLKKIAKIRL
jgi:hypothetical protein